MFAEVAPLYLQSLGIGGYDTAVVQGVILRLWGTGMERACGAAFLQCRFMNPFGNVCQRHHAAEGEGQYEDAEKYSADVVPVIPPFSVGREFGVTVAVCLAPYIHSYPDAGNNHEAAQSCEPDDGFSPKGGVLPQPGEVHPVGDGSQPCPEAFAFVGELQDFAVLRAEIELCPGIVGKVYFIDGHFLFQFSEGNPLVQRVEGVDAGNGRRTPQSCCPVQVLAVQRGS